ncbi:hypothetical protein L208DRAFT_182302 [Tricholoma matsutake]|nr:hypothetical protein L208DRAFT_182302 [Tricholoma matsutake 945]
MGKTCHGYGYGYSAKYPWVTHGDPYILYSSSTIYLISHSLCFDHASPILEAGIGITSIRANSSHLKAYCKYDTKYRLELLERDEKAAFDAGTILHQTMKDLKLKDPLRAGLMRRLHRI